FVSLDEYLDPQLMQAMLAVSDAKLERVGELRNQQSASHKSFWVRLLDEDTSDGKFSSDNPFVRFAIQKPVIHVLTEALGEVPQLSDVLLTLSEESNRELTYSQLWHRDFDDVRTVKLFAYLTDVPATADGPFTFFPGPVSDRFGRSLRSHLSDEE